MFIELNNVSKSFKGTLTLNDVTFSVPQGAVCGLVGINGSGKTLILKTICGLLKPDHGTCIVNGKTLYKDQDFPDSLGCLIENPAFLPNKTAQQNLELIGSIKNVATTWDIEKTLRRVELQSGNKKFRSFSLGMKQRLGIACALFERPDLIVLDEPTNSLDEDGVELVSQLIREEKQRGATIILTSHDSEFLEELCDLTFTVKSGVLEEARPYGSHFYR